MQSTPHAYRMYFTSPMEHVAAVEALRERTRPIRLTGGLFGDPTRKHEALFEGVVRESSFEIRLVSGPRNSLRPMLVGHLVEVPEGTDVFLRWSALQSALLIVMLICAAAALLAGFLACLSPIALALIGVAITAVAGATFWERRTLLQAVRRELAVDC